MWEDIRKILKRLLPLVLSICMLFTIGTQSAAAATMNECSAAVPALEYQSVTDKIAVAQEETTVQIGTETAHYYWGENSFVVQDSSGYYYVEINEDFTQFFVNGKAYDITRRSNDTGIAIPNDVTYPTEWSTIYDEVLSFNVGGLAIGIAGGIIGGTIATYFSSKLLNIAIGAVTGALSSTFIDGFFPMDYELSVDYLKMIRMLGPIEMEHFDAVGVYGGPPDDIYETEFYYGIDNYVKEYPE